MHAIRLSFLVALLLTALLAVPDLKKVPKDGALEPPSNGRSVRDFGAKCDAFYTPGTAERPGRWTGTDDTAALNAAGADNEAHALVFSGKCLTHGTVGINRPSGLFARPYSDDGIVANFASGPVLFLNHSGIEVSGLTFHHVQRHLEGADILVLPAHGGSDFTIADTTFHDPFMAVTIGVGQHGPSVSSVRLSRDHVTFKTFKPAPKAGCVLIDPGPSTGVAIDHLDDEVGFIDGVLTRPATCIEITNAGDVAIEDSNLALFDRALLVDPGPGQQVVSLRVAKTFFDSSIGANDVELFGNGGTIGRVDFFQSWVSSAAGGDGLLAHTARIEAGASNTPPKGSNSQPYACPVGSSCQGQIDGLDLVGLQALGNQRHGVNLDDYHVFDVRILGGAFAGNGGCGVHRTMTDGPFSMQAATASPWGFFGGNGIGLCLDKGSRNVVVEGNILAGNRLPNAIDVPSSPTEIIRDNIGYVAPCVPFTLSVGNAAGTVALDAGKPARACYVVDNGSVSVSYEGWIGRDLMTVGPSGFLTLGLPPGLAPAAKLPAQILNGIGEGRTVTGLVGRVGAGQSVVEVVESSGRYPGGGGTHFTISGMYHLN